uniref:Uncharacterized protein n=1 Tax=Anopheles arabiensis TaxID=7173 RepID=A0A182I3P3_ANOAR
MPSQPYDLVKDDQDIRVPLYPEQAFYGNGLTFQAKKGSSSSSSSSGNSKAEIEDTGCCSITEPLRFDSASHVALFLQMARGNVLSEVVTCCRINEHL